MIGPSLDDIQEHFSSLLKRQLNVPADEWRYFHEHEGVLQKTDWDRMPALYRELTVK